MARLGFALITLLRVAVLSGRYASVASWYIGRNDVGTDSKGDQDDERSATRSW